MRDGAVSHAQVAHSPDGASGLVRLAASTPWLIGAYFATQVMSRVLISPSLEMDEAEQLLLSQSLAWGYGPQPPLYTWLQILVFAVVGEGVFGVTLLKNALLALTCYAAFATVRMITRDVVTAALATLSLFLVPQIAWEAQRDLTHSVLVLAATASTVLAFVRVCETGSRTAYALFGLALAAGCLAKYNFVLLPVAMVAAALTLEELRPRVLSRRIAITAGVVLVTTAPTILWAITHQPAALEGARKLHMGAGSTAIDLYVAGLSRLATMVVAVIWPLVLVYGAAALSARREATRSGAMSLHARLLGRSLALALLLCVALVLAFEVTRIKDRWLLPLLYPTPLFLALWLRPRLSNGSIRLILGAAGTIALLVLVFMPARMLLEPRLGITNRLHFPTTALAERIRARGFDDGIILSDEELLAGNLRLAFPDSTAVVPDKPILPQRIAPCWLIAWRPERGEGVPDELQEHFRSMAGRSLDAEPAVISAPVVHSAGQSARLAIVISGCGPSASPQGNSRLR